MRITRRRLVGGLAASAVLPSAISAASTRPNIVFIMLDDVGKQGLDFYPSWETGALPKLVLDTPWMTAFAADSRVFDNARSTPICWTTRMETASGFKTWEIGAVMDPYATNNPLGLCTPSNYIFTHLPGYTTGAFGKWHLDLEFASCLEHPRMCGLDEWALSYDIKPGNPVERYWGANITTHENPAFVLPKTKFTDDWTLAKAQDFIRRHKSDPNPWYCQYWLNLSHDPIVDVPGFPKGTNDNLTQLKNMMVYMDRLVGSMLHFLRAQGLYENTFIIIASDNGGVGLTGGQKGDVGELGVSVPLMMRWPGMIRRGREPRMTQLADLFGTMAQAAGKPLARRFSSSMFPLFTSGTNRIHVFNWAQTYENNWMVCNEIFKLRTPRRCVATPNACSPLWLIDMRTDRTEEHPLDIPSLTGAYKTQAQQNYNALYAEARRVGFIQDLSDPI